MGEESRQRKDVLRGTDADAIRLGKTLIRTARHGALAVIDPDGAAPLASRVGVSTDIDGAPVILISRLSAHTGALLADPRCSLLVGEPGRGDPLAHPRISLQCTARELVPGSAEARRVELRYLNHQPKAKLYAGLGDFRFFRLEPQSASLNGGFGRAYALTAADVLTINPANDEIAETEPSAIAHMNEDHPATIGLYARHFANAPDGEWRLVGIDAEGMEIADGDDVRRIFFAQELGSAHDMHIMLVRMAGEARMALGVKDPASRAS